MTVVTVAFNAAATIVDTLRSVQAQTYPDVEHLVIDGGSTDGTQDLVRQHGQHVRSMISEPDQGLYDAMNKGLALAQGAVIGFLNADDWYSSPTSIERVVASFADDVDIVYGHLAQVDPLPPHRLRRLWRERPRSRTAFRLGWQPAHPATFIRTDLLRRLGGFNAAMRISADYDVFARCFLRERARAAFTPHLIATMRLGGASTSDLHSIVHGNQECLQALKECGVAFPLVTILLKLARKSLQSRAAAKSVAFRDGNPDA